MNQLHGCAFFAAAMVVLTHAAMGVPIYDNMGSTANLVGWVWPTNYQPSTATANADETVTFTRVAFWDAQAQVYPDAGIDWMPSKISLTPDHATLEVVPVSRDNGYYSMSVLYFNAAGDFMSEQYLTTNSSLIASQSWTLASDAPPPPAAQSYFVRVRIEPPAFYGDTAPVSVTFTQINAVPEPALAAVGAVGAPLLLRRRRKA